MIASYAPPQHVFSPKFVANTGRVASKGIYLDRKLEKIFCRFVFLRTSDVLHVKVETPPPPLPRC